MSPRLSLILALAAAAGGCSLDLDTAGVARPIAAEPISHEDCTVVAPAVPPAGGGEYESCAALLAEPGNQAIPTPADACYQLEDGSLARCRHYRMLVMATYEAGAPLPSPFVIEDRLTAVAEWFAEVSYGQVVLEWDVAGGLLGGEPARWFEATIRNNIDPEVLAEVHDDDLAPHELAEYDIFASLTTKDGRNNMRRSTVEVPSAAGAFDVTGWYTVIKQITYKSDITIERNFHHELGHSFVGVPDASGGSSLAGLDTGTYLDFVADREEYFDNASPMGAGERGHYSAWEKHRAGWLPEATIRDVPAGATETIVIGALETAAQETKAVRVPFDTGTYWIDAPRASELLYTLSAGAVVRVDGLVGSGELKDEVWALDATRETPSEKLDDGALLPGRTFADPGRGIYITVTGAEGDHAEVVVVRDPVNPSRPVIHGITVEDCALVSCAGPITAMSGAIGPTLRFTVDATDADGDELAVFWSFEVGLGDLYEPGSHGTGPVALHQLSSNNGRRVFVLVSDMKGGLALGHVDVPNDVVSPGAAGMFNYIPGAPQILAVASTQVGETNYQLHATVFDEELLVHHWTIDGQESSWPQPRHLFADPPTCVEVELVVGDRVRQSAPWAGCVALNQNPVARIEVESTFDPSWVQGMPVSAGDVFELSAIGSFDPDNGPELLGFEWTGDSCGLIDPAQLTNPEVTVRFPDGETLCSFEVTVSDGSWTSSGAVFLVD